jgi:hypothetical protein
MRGTALAVLVTLAAHAAGAGAEARLQPLVAGWEHVMTVDYDVVAYDGKPAVQGYVTNISTYGFDHIRILIDELDANGRLAAQEVAFVPGRLGGRDHLFFQVPVRGAASYRVQVFSYDRTDRKQ